jgi:hypothetical protein
MEGLAALGKMVVVVVVVAMLVPAEAELAEPVRAVKEGEAEPEECLPPSSNRARAR